MRLLLDEMYPPLLADALNETGIDSVTVATLGLRGAADPDVFTAAQADHRSVLTENVADFTQLAALWVTSAHHHAGLLIALSSRFSRRPEGIKASVAAITAVGGEVLGDRVIYLESDAE